MYFAHRVNTLYYVYDLYYSYDVRSIEIDVQKTKDGRIVVFHDDVSEQNMCDLPYYVPTFEEFLRFIPSYFDVNVEIKNYHIGVGCEDLVDKVLAISKKYHHNYYFSSFDHDIYTEFVKRDIGKCWHLQDTLQKYKPYVSHICIHKHMLPFIDQNLHEFIAVYDVESGEELEDYRYQYPFVNTWIIDFVF